MDRTRPLAVPFLPSRFRSLASLLRAAGPPAGALARAARRSLAGPRDTAHRSLAGPRDTASPGSFPELAGSPVATGCTSIGLAPVLRRSAPPDRRRPSLGRATTGAGLVAAVALMVSLGTGVWDPPHPAPSAAALVRAAAHIAPAELPVVAGPAIAPAPTQAPAPTAAPVQHRLARPVVSSRPRTRQGADSARFARMASAPVGDSSVAGFVPLYQLAGQTFGVNWMLIASIHSQETSFSSDPSTYQGLNSAGCCGGPMQFNVTNGPVSTWSLVSDSFRYAARPASYPHQTQNHPSIYDDFDAIMAAARLLVSNGATQDLAAGSWRAAYGYYGHDATGITYADQVLARAIVWSQQGFCPSCATDPAVVAAVHEAYAPGGSGTLASFLSTQAATSPSAPAASAPATAAPSRHHSSHHRRAPASHSPSRHHSPTTRRHSPTTRRHSPTGHPSPTRRHSPRRPSSHGPAPR